MLADNPTIVQDQSLIDSRVQVGSLGALALLFEDNTLNCFFHLRPPPLQKLPPRGLAELKLEVRQQLCLRMSDLHNPSGGSYFIDCFSDLLKVCAAALSGSALPASTSLLAHVLDQDVDTTDIEGHGKLSPLISISDGEHERVNAPKHAKYYAFAYALPGMERSAARSSISSSFEPPDISKGSTSDGEGAVPSSDPPSDASNFLRYGEAEAHPCPANKKAIS